MIYIEAQTAYDFRTTIKSIVFNEQVENQWYVLYVTLNYLVLTAFDISI